MVTISAENITNFWHQVRKFTTPALHCKAEFVSALADLALPELVEVAATTVLQATTTATDNYSARHNRLV